MEEVIVLNDQEVANLVGFEQNLLMVEQAFSEYSQGKSHVFPVVREAIAKHSGIFGIKSGYIESQAALGFKAGGFWANNKKAGLPNHQSAICLFNPTTGQLRALVAANFVTQVRTAAIGAIGCKYLARPDSRVLAVIGTGQQGRNQLEATLKVLPEIREVWLYDAAKPAAESLASAMINTMRVHVADSAEQACCCADVIVTATSSFTPIVMDQWVKPGTHVNAIGTDTRGKQELDPAIFKRAAVVVDNLAQCCYLGECQHAYDAGIISQDSIRGEIGEIINKTRPGRITPDEITVFDTTGVAIQDLATAGYALEEAIKRGVGSKIII